MSVFADIIGGGLGKLIKDVVGTFKLTPEEKAKFETLIEEHAHEIQLKEYELQVKSIEAENKAIEEASANIRAEAQSGDKFTSRARPTFLYIIYIVILFNFITLPIIQMFKGATTLLPLDLPEDLYYLFGAGYLGYTSARMLDKSGYKWGRKTK